MSQTTTPNDASWEGVNKTTMLKLCKAVDQAHWPYGKSFYSSYHKWDDLTPKQKDKAITWFRDLPSVVQDDLYTKEKETRDATDQMESKRRVRM